MSALEYTIRVLQQNMHSYFVQLPLIFEYSRVNMYRTCIFIYKDAYGPSHSLNYARWDVLTRVSLYGKRTNLI